VRTELYQPHWLYRLALARREEEGSCRPRTRPRYGLRHWVGQSYKQVKDELGWGDF
jgi:hypothetical protein